MKSLPSRPGHLTSLHATAGTIKQIARAKHQIEFSEVNGVTMVVVVVVVVKVVAMMVVVMVMVYPIEDLMNYIKSTIFLKFPPLNSISSSLSIHFNCSPYQLQLISFSCHQNSIIIICGLIGYSRMHICVLISM